MKLWSTMSRFFKTKEAAPRDPKKVAVKKVGQAIKGAGGSDFEDNPVDLEEIFRAYQTDSYIKRAINKYNSLMFKQGWDISGKNEAASEYVWTRLKLMEEATQQPLERLFNQIGYDLILFGNAYVVKARQKGSMGGATGVKAVGYTAKQPVAGYFILPPTTIKVSRDEQGKVVGYEQSTTGGDGITFKPEDVIHFTYNKPTGRAYGVPLIFNVLDDVKMLRQIEENVARLVHRNLFPLYIYQVGLDKPGWEADDTEIENIREEINSMPMDGGIVVPERHNISVLGSQGNALDASPYLKYYRQRVFSGLGVSDSVMGIGDTANKATSDNMSADLNDGVKEFQRIMAEVVQYEIINELLFEGGYDPVLNVDDEVLFTFHEIELDAKTKKENHIVQMFSQNVITHEEMRMMMGLDPVADESRLNANMFAAGTVDEGAANAGDNKDQPENQSGKQDSPGKAKKENLQENEENDKKLLTENTQMVTFNPELDINNYQEEMEAIYISIQDDVLAMVEAKKSKDHIEGFVLNQAKSLFNKKHRLHMERAISKGLAYKASSSSANLQLQMASMLNPQFEKSMTRFVDDLSKMLDRHFEEDYGSEQIASLIGAFYANRYRIKTIVKTEWYRAYNFGIAVSLKETGVKDAVIFSQSDCNKCKQTKISLEGSLHDVLHQIPPHHPNCECLVGVL